MAGAAAKQPVRHSPALINASPCAGLVQLSREHPGDASAAPLHTLLCHLLTDEGSYAAAQLQAEEAYELVKGKRRMRVDAVQLGPMRGLRSVPGGVAASVRCRRHCQQAQRALTPALAVHLAC